MMEQGITTVASTISSKADLTNKVVETAYTFKDYLEMAYFVTGGPLLLIVAGFGLYQLKLMKEQTETAKKAYIQNAQREAIKLTNEQCHLYLTKVIDREAELYHALKDNKFDYIFEKDFIQYEIRDNEIVFLDRKNKYKDLKILFDNKEVIGLLLSIINSIEAFSSYFISEVADEEIAYRSVGQTFINTVDRYMGAIILSPSSNDTSYNQNTIKLFLLWKRRNEEANQKKEYLKEKEKILEKEEQIKNHQNSKIKPIGTY